MVHPGMTFDLSAFDSEQESTTAEGGVPPARPPAVEPQPNTIDYRIDSRPTREQFRTPLVGVDGVSASPLFGSAAHAGVDQRLEQPVRSLVQALSGGIWQHVAPLPAAVSARFSDGLGRLQTIAAAGPFGATRLQQSMDRLRALQGQLKPMARLAGIVALAVVALGAVAVSGWLLFTTFVRPPSQSATIAAPAQTAAAAMPRSDASAPPAPAPVSSPANTQAASSASARMAAASLPITAVALKADDSREAVPRRPARATSPAVARPSPPSERSGSAPSELSESSSASQSPAAARPLAEASRAASNVASPPAVAPRSLDAQVYSASDVGVIPPVQTYPRLVEPIAANHPNASPVMVVINEQGTVESAVLARKPTDMRQAVSGTLVLAAAKASRFQPATKDGQPVKYRHLVWFLN
jgi:hypothetical protein